jgi:MraZ protein
MLPAKLRDGFDGECMVVLGPDRNIRLYGKDEYLRFLREHVLNRPMEDPDARELHEFYTTNARECAIDKQGRVNLPPKYINYADIKKETVTVGNATYVSIWSKERYDASRNPITTDVSALFKKMLKYDNESQ